MIRTAWSLGLSLLLMTLSAVPAQSQVRFRTDEQVDDERAALREQILGQDVEVFRLDCRNSHYRREVSMFGTGTLRVREGSLAEPEMWLGELDRNTTSALIEQLQLPDLTEVAATSRTVVGDWVETCTYWLNLPGEEQRRFQFERLDSLKLPLQKSLNVAITALGMVDRSVPSESRARLAANYVPKRGDVLIATDGREFRVAGFANQETVVELVGVDQPVLRHYAVNDLANHFVGLKAPER